MGRERLNSAGGILVADVGGTNTRIAIALPSDEGWQLRHLQLLVTRQDFPRQLRDYIADPQCPAFASAAFCGAGPVLHGKISLTNADLVLDPAELAAACGLRTVSLLNDFEAIAHALPALSQTGCRQLGGGAPRCDRPRLAVGCGTGFGAAAVIPAGDRSCVVAGEAGHARLAVGEAVVPEDASVWNELTRLHAPLTVETILSGSGLQRLYQALGGATLDAAGVADAAWRGEPQAQRAVQLFVATLGRVTADLCLVFSALGGVYLAGGILPGWGERFDVQGFMRAFHSTPSMQPLLREVPVYMVTVPQPGLIGLAAYAAQRQARP